MREQSPEQFENALNAATFSTFMWKCRAKAETYQEEERVKVNASDVFPVNHVTEAKYLVCCLFVGGKGRQPRLWSISSCRV